MNVFDFPSLRSTPGTYVPVADLQASPTSAVTLESHRRLLANPRRVRRLRHGTNPSACPRSHRRLHTPAMRRAHRSRTTRLIDGCACVPHRCCRRLEGLRAPLLPRAQLLAARAAELAAPPPQVGALCLARRVGLGVSAMSRSSAQLASWAR